MATRYLQKTRLDFEQTGQFQKNQAKCSSTVAFSKIFDIIKCMQWMYICISAAEFRHGNNWRKDYEEIFSDCVGIGADPFDGGRLQKG
ncbi:MULTISPECIES: hypothetical protein [Anaerotruncus]|uniref:hypothetical protein n=1 Tax=Anaerotruncus TaxID=244127 RepID=UPI00138F598F|nr:MULTISPECIES: hypothetical protein [Anaerotruncus]MCI8493168.1 hypothetical protein [Anaerotruncus sp.]MCR2025665.1 hypothetical protein [Anaerotruncus colihominis]